jgi:excisionase family DNA binding protein
LSLKAAAGYLGCSTWTIRAWLADGTLTRVRLPRPGGGEMDRLLLDVTDLDALIEAGKA